MRKSATVILVSKSLGNLNYVFLNNSLVINSLNVVSIEVT